MKTGEPATDEEFFGKINLDLAGLENVSKCVKYGDWAKARQELYIYMREKFRRAQYYTPSSFDGDKVVSSRQLSEDSLILPLLAYWIQLGKDRLDLGDAESNLMATAAMMAKEGRVPLRATGSVYQFDPSKPFDFIDFDPNNRDYDEHVQMYTLWDIALLREGYFRSGEDIYLERATQIVTSYWKWFGGGASGPAAAEVTGEIRDPLAYNPWDMWDVSWRISSCIRFLTLLQKSDLDIDAVVDVLKTILEDIQLHVARCRDGWWTGNRIVLMCSDGAEAAAALYEFNEAGDWWQDFTERIFAASSHIFPDGSMDDFSVSYSETYVTWIERLEAVVEAFGSPMRIEPPHNAQERYRAMLDWQSAMRKPDGTAVQYNDCSMGQPLPWYGRLGLKLLGGEEREVYSWFASEGKEGRPPAHTSFPRTSPTLSYAGMYVMRSDWSPDARYLLVDFGPYGTAHGHADYGSFILHAYGALLIDEGGCPAYGSEANECYSKQAWAHNTIMIDGFGQRHWTHRSSSAKDLVFTKGHLQSDFDPIFLGRPECGKPLSDWITNAVYDLAWGSYPFAEASPELSDVVHHRHIYFVKPDYYVLLDSIEGTGLHTIRSKIQLSWLANIKIAANAVQGQIEHGPAVYIQPFDNRPAPKIVIAQKEPFWDGWTTKVPNMPTVEPAPSVVYEEQRELPASYATLLHPVPEGIVAGASVKQEAADGGESLGVLLTVDLPDKGYRDEIMVNRGNGAVSFSSKSLSTDGRFVQVRYEGEILRTIAFVDASKVKLPVYGRDTIIELETGCNGHIKLDAEDDFASAEVFLEAVDGREQCACTIRSAGCAPVNISRAC